MKTIITIPGRPIALKRPRGGRNLVYDSHKGLKEEIYCIVKMQYEANITTKDNQPPLGPVDINIQFFMAVLKGLAVRRRPQMYNTPHAKRPDLDNLVKFYLDVCNGILYKDCSQVYIINATKTYSDIPKTVITATYGDVNG